MGVPITEDGPKGRPNNLPQPAWRLAELFFQSELSWLRADLCANSYVISTRFSLFGGDTTCTHYISYVGIERIIQFGIIRIYDNIDICRIRHYRFSTYLWLLVFFDFLNNMYLSSDFFFDISSHGVCF